MIKVKEAIDDLNIAINDYLNYMKTPSYKKKLKRRILNNKDISNILKIRRRKCQK